MPIRVVLAEDQAMVLGALAALLELEPDIIVIGREANGRDALRVTETLKPEVLVTDIEMPGMTGLEVAAALKLSRPAVRTIILTTFPRPGYLRRALDAGARGYLLEDRPASELADAVRRVHQRLRVVDPALAAEAWGAEADPLTERERQILQLAGEGQSSGAIASALHLSEGTVRNYLSEPINKLGAQNRVDAARIARVKAGFGRYEAPHDDASEPHAAWGGGWPPAKRGFGRSKWGDTRGPTEKASAGRRRQFAESRQPADGRKDRLWSRTRQTLLKFRAVYVRSGDREYEQ